jgi:Ni/Fe-hydrogenase subunit HybB-like protein
MERISKTKLVLWTILGITAAIALTRFLFGLGVTTNLTDNTPWGFWIGFDVMGGVALAAGGFVIAAFNYIFGRKKMHAVARAAILTAFLGYLAVAVGLLFDLGLPWNIWHMIIFWNPHSPLFEVGWCVMLYLSVLTMEFAPVVLEKYPKIPLLTKINNALVKVRIPIVILGIMFSTLHQSSLGSLFLAMPYKLHPLWYSPIIPVIFFFSAICLGLMMVMVESMTSAYLYKKEQEESILEDLKKYASWMLIFYLLLRFGDIFYRGANVFLFDGSIACWLFWIEILLSVFIPLVIFKIPFKKLHINILYFGALAGVAGIVFNRLNVGGLTHLNNISGIGEFYFPSLMELMVSAGVVSAAMLCFFFFVENFKVWEKAPEYEDCKPKVKPQLNSFNVYLGNTKTVNRTKFSFAFVIAFAFTFFFISGTTIGNKGLEHVRVKHARGGDTLLINGNRDEYVVKFRHVFHQKELGVTCGYCHHLNKPDDKATSCYECHDDMYVSGDAFRHDWHSSPDGVNLDCFKCHDKSVNKGAMFRDKEFDFNKMCKECHEPMIPTDSRIPVITTYKTLSYTDAMHNLCIKCHEERLASDTLLAARKPDLAKCGACHQNFRPYMPNTKLVRRRKDNKWVVVPFN